MKAGTGLCSDDYKGRFGIPAGLGAYVCGDNRLGDYSEVCGVYQRQVTKQGKKISLHRDNWSTCPRTPAQVAWFNLFKEAMEAWKALDTETKQEYNARVYPRHWYGINRFISEYIKAHR